MPPDFTPNDLDEARRLNAKLDRLPRFRMQTIAGRLALNVLLWLSELYPMVRHPLRRPRPERRVISSEGYRIRLRVFRCDGRASGVVLHFHGGGWTIGNARMSDQENAALAARLQVTVVAVDYRLALSRPLTDVIAQCAAAAGWVLDHARQEFGSSRIVIEGFSAGAHLAAAALLRLRDQHPNFTEIRGAMLYFGLYDLAGTDMVRSAGPDVLVLHGPTVRTTLKKLTPDMSDAERRDPSLSPLFANLDRLPPGLFLVGADDMLLEDNRRMADRWQIANGNASLIVAPESPHAFDRFDTSIARKVRSSADAWLTAHLRVAE